MLYMESHQGQTIERIIRRNGHNISDLARLTNVNRRSVYNWFNQRKLKPEIIFKIGLAIDYDFTTVFPSLSLHERPDVRAPSAKPISIENTSGAEIWKDKYLELLERYNKLLLTYIENANHTDLAIIRELVNP